MLISLLSDLKLSLSGLVKLVSRSQIEIQDLGIMIQKLVILKRNTTTDQLLSEKTWSSKNANQKLVPLQVNMTHIWNHLAPMLVIECHSVTNISQNSIKTQDLVTMNQTKVRSEVILHLSQLDKVSAPVNRTNLLDRYQWIKTHLYHMIPQPNLDKIAKDLLSASRETARSLGAQDLVILRLMLP